MRATLVLFTLTSLTYGLTYYADDSCWNFLDFDLALEEAIKIAGLTYARLASTTDNNDDKDFDNVFSIIFNGYEYKDKNKYAEAKADVRRPFRLIMNMKEASNLKQSDIRFFCDNDRVYDPTDPKSRKGRRWEKLSSTLYVDEKNMMSNPVLPQCNLPGIDGTTYVRHWQTRLPGHNKDDENDDRVTITICDQTFQKPPPKIPPDQTYYFPQAITNDFPSRDWTGYRIDNFHHLITGVIIHELMHAVTKGGIKDAPPDLTTGWEKIEKMPRETANKNAESYAVLARFAMLAQWGWTLPRLRTQPKDTEAEKQCHLKQVEEGIRVGLLAKNGNLFRRQLARTRELRRRDKTLSNRVRAFLGEDKFEPYLKTAKVA
ncbi:hypothetical protein BDV96DRAFT_644463 [Lophiotrema nucula]|uniref:Lysine-specific metallo-endopeptidase domain-containing protein n=1 Tax=Lophiotrema nucula TaxID=690887 RepID=A0A6A5ZE72_9PLEO|nr:hypothetical protein BDV96DRAFT_644463 [Lophiotrema nucula]